MRIWKLSHGINTFTPNELFAMRENHQACVHRNTPGKGTSSVTQGEEFYNKEREGEFFYLCYSNTSVELFGRFNLNISYSVWLAFLALKNILQTAFSCRKQGELPWERHSVGRLSGFLKVQGTPKPSPVARRPELVPTKSFRQLMSLTL